MKRDHPTDVQILIQSACAAEAAGYFDRAEEICRRALLGEPRNLEALLLRGVVTAKMGQQTVAIERFNSALQVDGENPMALGWLSTLLREAGRIDEAISCAQRAIRVKPDDAENYYRLGLCFLAQNRHHDAVLVIERACEIRPDNAVFLYGLSGALDAFGRPWDAIRALQRASDLAPHSKGLIRLAHLLLAQNKPTEALQHAEKAVALSRDSAPAHLILAEVLTALGRDAEAQPNYSRAYALDPSLERSYSVTRAKRLQSLGRMEDAEVHFRKALASDPGSGAAYYGLATSRRITEEDRPLIQEMEAALNASRLDPQSRVSIHYALGKALDEVGDYERAMRHFDKANALLLESRHSSRRFRPEVFRQRIEAQIALFTPKFVEETRRFGSKNGLPILITGMMRSGTTLANQILSSHPAVGSAGEQSYWSFGELKLINHAEGSIDVTGLRAYAEGYADLLADVAPGHEFVIDKNPANTMVLGLIHCALPNSRIIHLQRKPVDTCLSIYMTALGTPPDFGNDRNNIVYAYRQYERLAEHWSRVLPPERFMVVRYEDLVTDREATTRRMLEFCGLSWDEACLHPERNEAKVGTPSFWQVRRPVHTTSMEKWRHYEPWLGAFRELLEESDSMAKLS